MFFSNLFRPSEKVLIDDKPGRLHPSIMTEDLYYDFSNDNRGIALIFNHEKFKGEGNRAGTRKDGDDLKAVLEGLQFEVRDYMDRKLDQILEILYNGKTFQIGFKH